MTTVKEFWEMQCPNCGDDSALAVQALIWVTLHGDGTEDEGGDHEWDDKSKAMCKACGWNGSIIQCQEAFTNSDLERLKAQALTALREARFADYDAALKDYHDAGGTDDLESEVCNIVSAEIEQGLYK